MTAAQISIRTAGNEGEPLVVVDDFAADADVLRQAALAARFEPAPHLYPGLRAPLPDTYLQAQLPVIATGLGRHFGRFRRIHVIDAGFAIVTARPDTLDIRQRLPHVDAYGADRIALVHYLSPTNRDGTAFYRHRSTGFETIDAARAPDYFAGLEGELRRSERTPAGYIAGDTEMFEQVAIENARYNRALLYRSYRLHSGAIAPDAVLSPDPATGRLTVTAFLAIE